MNCFRVTMHGLLENISPFKPQRILASYLIYKRVYHIPHFMTIPVPILSLDIYHFVTIHGLK